jgi:hypothetical protein
LNGFTAAKLFLKGQTMQGKAASIKIPKDVLKKDTGFNEVFNNNPTKTGRRANRRMIRYREVKERMVPSGDYAIAPDESLRRLDKLKARMEKQLKGKK